MFNFKQQTNQENSGNSAFLKINPNQSIEGVLAGEMIDFKKAFNEGDAPKFRFRVNMIISNEGKLEAKILEGGWKLYTQLGDLQAAGWDLKKTKIKISRVGEKLQTVYTATVLPNPVPEAILKAMASLELKPLMSQKG